MPDYDYKCLDCGHKLVINHPMINYDAPRCPKCAEVRLQKVYKKVNINWGGLRPSQGEIHPNIKQLIDDAPRRRDETIRRP